jgi:pyruvate kinase
MKVQYVVGFSAITLSSNNNVHPLQVARFDFTWGTVESHQETLDILREAMKRTQTYCAVLFEAMGREIVVLNRYKHCSLDR